MSYEIKEAIISVAATLISVTIAAICLLTLVVNVAHAQGLPYPPTNNKFTGCYVGAAGGIANSQTDVDYQFVGPLRLGADLGSSGGLFSLGLGCDINVGKFVFGVWGDYDWNNQTADIRLPFNNVASLKTGDMWTIGGRLGWLLTDDTMAYGLLGWTDLDDARLRVAGRQFNAGGSGYVVGGGLETALSNSLRLGAEYRYSDTDGTTFRRGFFNSGFGSDVVRIDPEVQSVRVTLKYVFNAAAGPPPPLK